MPPERQYAVLGPLPSGAETRAFLGCEVVDGLPKRGSPIVVVWLPEDATKEAKQVARLQRETTFVTQLRHPNIIRVHGLECFEEGWARIVDYCDGEPLSRVLAMAREKVTPLSPKLAARIMIDACDGVHHAHEHGLQSISTRPIVHGAIRPDTLMVTFSGVTMVTGYGAAVLATAQGTDFYKKFVVPYLAPEQIIGGKATASQPTDNYALGAVFYELLAGKPPFAGIEDVESAIMTAEPEKLHLTGLGGRLAEIAARAMSKRATDRFSNVAAMRAAILAALEDGELAPHAQLSAFVGLLIPSNAPERTGRETLLESTKDPDLVTVLSRKKPPEAVDHALHEVSRATSSPPPPVERSRAVRPSQPAPAPASAPTAAEITEINAPAHRPSGAPPPRSSQPPRASQSPQTARSSQSPVVVPSPPPRASQAAPARPSLASPPRIATSAEIKQALGSVVWEEDTVATTQEAPLNPLATPVARTAPSREQDVTVTDGRPPVTSAPEPSVNLRTPLDRQPTIRSPTPNFRAPHVPGAPVDPASLAAGLIAPAPGTPSAPAPAPGAPSPAPGSSMPVAPPPPHAPGASRPSAAPSASAPAVMPSAPMPNAPTPSMPNAPMPNAPYIANAQVAADMAAAGMLAASAATTAPGVVSQSASPLPPFTPPAPAGAPAPAMQSFPGGGAWSGAPQPGVPYVPPVSASIPPQSPLAGPRPSAAPAPVRASLAPAPAAMPPQGHRPSQAPGIGTAPPIRASLAPAPQHGNYLSHPPQPAAPPAPAPQHGNYLSHPPQPAAPPAPAPQQGNYLSQPPASSPPARTSLAPAAAAPYRPLEDDDDTNRIAGRSKAPRHGAAHDGAPAKPMAFNVPSAVPQRQMEVSSVTAFRKNAGDSSKSMLFIAIFMAAGLMVAVFMFGKEPPKGLSEEPERHKLPKDLVEMALKAPLETPELPPSEPPLPTEPELVAPKTPVDGQPEAPPVPEKPKLGELSLSTEPQVDVYVGNYSLGRTPFTTRLPAGTHKLRFTDGKTGINIYKQYRIAPGGEHRDSITFGTSELNIQAPNGASVMLNGRAVGKAPLDPIKIYEGKYHLKVSFEGKVWTEWFDAPAGKKIEYRVTMRAE